MSLSSGCGEESRIEDRVSAHGQHLERDVSMYDTRAEVVT